MPSEYLVAHGQHISSAAKESVIEADRMIEVGERTVAAWQAAFSADTSFHAGIVAITTHRLLCCSCIANNLISVSLPFSEYIDIGNETGIIRKQLPIHCRNVTIVIRAPINLIAQIKASILKGIETAPIQEPILFEPAVFRQCATARRQIQKIKSTHKDERRLSKAETADYGKCPTCQGHVLIEKKRGVYCASCGYRFNNNKKSARIGHNGGRTQ